MKFNFDKQWLERYADTDENLEIAAGAFCIDQLPPTAGDLTTNPPALAFGRLINLSRRKRGWTIEDLAASARIDAAEAIRIEHDATYIPGPRTVYQLSTTLGLPRDQMLQLSGNMLARDRYLG